MHIKTQVHIILRLLAILTIVAVFSSGAYAYTEEEEQEAAAGANASNPTAAVNFQDIRYRYFDLNDSAKKGSQYECSS